MIRLENLSINLKNSKILTIMIGITEELGKIINVLEDAIEESDWKSVQKCYDDLDDLYDKLERGDDAYQDEYN